MRIKVMVIASVVSAVLAVSGASVLGEAKPVPKASKSMIKNGKKGDPPLGTTIAFGPDGLLLMGAKKSLYAIETGDTKAAKGEFKKIDNLKAALAEKFGDKPNNVSIWSTAFNPASGKLYCTVSAAKGMHIAVVSPDGTVDEFKLKDVNYAEVKFPFAKEEADVQFTTIVWTDKQVICSVFSVNNWAGHVVSVPVPVVNGADGAVVDCYSYHTTHQQWETRSPLTSIAVYEHDKKSYMVAGVSCTPVIQYPIDEIKQGEQLKGTTPFDLYADDIQDLLTYKKEGKDYLLLTFATNNGHTCLRINHDFLTEKTAVNEKASTIVRPVNGVLGVPKEFADRVKKLDDFENVVRTMRLNDKQVLVLKNVKEVVSLEVLDLPEAAMRRAPIVMLAVLMLAACGQAGASKAPTVARPPDGLVAPAEHAAVACVYPRGGAIPANTLQFFIQFRGPMTPRDDLFEYFAIEDEKGVEVDAPFLRSQFWSGDFSRLTLRIHPGRIKHELRDIRGMVLQPGRRFTLVVKPGLQAATGRSIEAEFRQTYDVGPEDRKPILPQNWSCHTPGAGTTDPLVIDFGERMNAIMVRACLSVTDAGGEVNGEIEVSDGDDTWRFTPSSAWRDGDYHVRVAPQLEDLAGNRPGALFDKGPDDPDYDAKMELAFHPAAG